MLQWFARRMQEAKEDQKGFTLIELLVVVIIIGILMAIAVPIYLNQRQNAQDDAAGANLRSAASAQQLFYQQNNRFGETADIPVMRSQMGYPGTEAVPEVLVDDATTDNTQYCVEATSESGAPFHIDETTGAPADGLCP